MPPDPIRLMGIALFGNGVSTGDTVHNASGLRIEDLVRNDARRIEERKKRRFGRSEVPGFVSGSRHRRDAVVGYRGLAELLEIEEEEGLVFAVV